jgi:SlyX protein
MRRSSTGISADSIGNMTDNDLSTRVETLEIRLMHQETAIEELTRTLLHQEQLVREQAQTIDRLEAQLRALTPSQIATREEETPPPHY